MAYEAGCLWLKDEANDRSALCLLTTLAIFGKKCYSNDYII